MCELTEERERGGDINDIVYYIVYYKIYSYIDILAGEPSFAWKLNILSKSQPTQLRIFKPG